MKNNKLMKNIVNSFKINTLSSRKGLGVGLTCLFLTLGMGQMWGAELKNGQYIYINYSTTTWGSSSAKFKFNWYWNVGDYCCVNQEAGRVTGENYAYAQTQNEYTRAVQILRFNSTYGTQWNYTNTVAVSSNTKNCITLTAAVSDNYTFSWTTYAPPMSTVTLADNGTSIVSGSGTSGDPYLVYVSTPIKVSASGTKAVADPDATINYNFKQGSTSKQNGTGTTYQFDASSTPNTTYTLNLDGYTKVGSTSSSTKAATALYYKTIAAAEPTHDVTISYKYSSTTIKDATTESAVGESTARSITAPSIAGYTFSSWTKGAGVNITSGSTSTATISITTNSSGAYTLTANYTEDLSSPYTIKGGTNITGNEWSTAYNMTKKSGHSTESVVYYTFNISSTNSGVSGEANTWSFKVIKDGSTWYGLSADAGTSYWWQRSTTANQNLASGDGGKNIQICADVAGPYEIKVDYTNPASPTVTVTFPTSYTLTYSIGSVAGNNGNISTSPTTASGSKVLSGNSVTLTGPAAKTGYTWKGWYTDAGGTTGKITDTNRAITVTMNADKTLYACYTENSYNVTVSNDGHGTVSPTGTVAVKQISGTALTATPSTNYVFKDWTISGGGITPTTSSSNPQTFKATTTGGTIRANFADQWAICGIPNWETWNGLPNITTNVYQGTIDLTAGNHSFKVVDRKNNVWYTKNGTTLTRASNSVTANETGGMDNNITITADVAGTYTFNFNKSTKVLTVTYPTAYTITYGVGTINGSSTAVSVSPSFTSGDYVLPETDVTFSKGSTKSGYTWKGWYSNVGGTGDAWSTTDASLTLTATRSANISVYACYTLQNYTATLSTTGKTGYGSGAPANQTVTYTQAMPTITPPTAANGYAFMGYWDGENGTGTKYYNANGTSAHVWDKTSAATLHAYFKKAEITGITFSPASAEPGQTVTATATISPTPVAPTTVCWEVRYAANDNPLSPQPTFTPEAGASVSFEAPGAGVYKFVATLRTGSSCAAGDVLSTANENFTVTGSHSVTIRYKHGDAVIKEEIIQNIHAIDPTQITAPSIVGYSFSSWTLGDGITKTSGTLTSPSIYVTAIYDGVITANYNPKRMIYFYNTLGWSNVYAYFYSNDKYWGYGSDEGKGTGSSTTWEKDGVKPFIKSGAMTRIAGTNIWYYDCEANSIASSVTNVAFTSLHQTDYTYFAKTSTTKNNVVRRGDYNSAMPMFVPVDQDGVSMNGGLAIYYNEGYWMNYPENTGYTVRIYNAWNADKTSPAREYYFPYSSDKKMPLKLDVEFNTTDAKWFMIYRNDGAYLSVNAVMTQASHTNYRIKDSNDKIKIQPSAPGIYTYTLTYYDDEEKDGSGKAYGNMYHITVDYPVSVGDYRILYKDNATWSQGWAHNSAGHAWCHPSDAINKITGGATEAKKDTVSLFVSYGASPTAKFQYVSAINPSTGVVTWKDVAGGTINLSSITKSGTYNFIISQPVGGASVSVEKIEAYTGNYYIRTDCAGNTKWDNYRAADHQMTYSEFSCSEANSFGEKFSHYFAHWCPAGMNVKFVIANDYSSCISDTLIQDVGNTYANINGDGSLNSDGNAEETENRYSANIRFMYNEATNKISRAYVASSTNDARWFLVLRSNSEIHGEDNIAVEDIGTGKPSVILDDKQNWIYEQTLKILPGTRFKLFACYADVTPTEARAQYFRGNYATNSWSNENTIELVGGNPASGYQLVRVLYDFKTNRLVCAWLPDGTVSGDNAINADVMVIREHQEDARMITFDNSSSKLSGVKTVYGAMKFNRWTLNNKSSESGHAVLDPSHQKSVYERALYFISFPFDVNLGEVFGFGTYGVHWIIEYYDGLTRAKNGYWIDSPPNWKYVMSPKGYTLEANRGYILCLDLDLMKDDNEEFWPHGIETVELFFPSSSSLETIKQTNCTIPALSSEYQCTINRGTGTEGDRRVKDSYWRCLGVPSFANYTTELSNGTSTITWQPTGNTLPFLYAWNMTDNTLTPQNTSTWAFKTMHAYLAQCPTQIIWSATSGPSSIVARRENEMPITEYEWRLELAQDSQMVDQAYIRMSNLEQVTDTFDFGQDLSKEFNATRSNIYSFIGYEKAAANSMPLKTEQTTIVAIGLNIITAGEYTLGMPDGTDGVGVTLVDSETGTRTNLSAGMTYTVTLAAGDYTSRFYLEISPVKETPTGLEQLPTTNDQSPIKKLLIDGILYIVRDGKIFDARGVMVK